MPDGGAVARAGDDVPTTASGSSPLVLAAERLVTRITVLVDEVAALRQENAALRREVKEAVAMLEQAARGGSMPTGERRAKLAPVRRRRRAKAAKGRATPDSVTAEVVRAVLAKFGTATAAEIAQEITKAGAPVSGRAVRFLAERAGAQTFIGEDGQRRYRI